MDEATWRGGGRKMDRREKKEEKEKEDERYGSERVEVGKKGEITGKRKKKTSVLNRNMFLYSVVFINRRSVFRTNFFLSESPSFRQTYCCSLH